MKWLRWLLAAAFLLAAAGCGGNDDIVFTTVEAAPPPAQDPAHNQGKNCVDCHTDWNLVAMHDSGSAVYNPDCISCHGDMSDETTLSEEVKGVHPAMIPWILPATGEDRITNLACRHCHESTDLLGRSAGNLRRQVDVQVCASCHGPAGPGKQFYR